MRLDRAQRRLDRRYPEGPNRPAAKEQGTQAKVSGVSGDQELPRRSQVEPRQRQDDVASPDEELTCPTYDKEEEEEEEEEEDQTVDA